jgi:hypothetical protein
MRHKSEDRLNIAVMVYVLLDLFAFGWLRGMWGGAALLFAVIPIVLGIWAIIVARHHFKQGHEAESIPYRRLTSGDYYRWFFIVWAGWTPLATAYEAGFLLAAAVAIVSVLLAVTIAVVELYRRRDLSPLVIGMGCIVYFFLSWLKMGYCHHYGVPIIGHFFERPEYSARYMVTASRVNEDYNRSGPEMRIVADIRVGGRSETDDVGEDRFGQTITKTFDYRDVWLKRLHLSPSQVVTIDEQDEPLSMGESVYVTDSRGGKWHVALRDEPVP